MAKFDEKSRSPPPAGRKDTTISKRKRVGTGTVGGREIKSVRMSPEAPLQSTSSPSLLSGCTDGSSPPRRRKNGPVNPDTGSTATIDGYQVRVAVRVRPLTSSERSLGGNSVVRGCPLNRTVGIGSKQERKFTYDAVFDPGVSQMDLYKSVSTQLLNPFLDGYNATIMAYGQTGSGKTYTMGSEAHPHGKDVADATGTTFSSHQHGLIPRFMNDIFASLDQAASGETDRNMNITESAEVTDEKKRRTDFQVTASFLEVYGEDIHDLLDEDRKSLPLREDSNGGVMVVGLKDVTISSAADALNVLHTGTLHRTTAATLMNHTSSRSHAVFAISLQRTVKSSASGDSEPVDVTTSSRLTFVDLAGSERMKKTGAEGERAREGIKINEGLLALGNVINALADEGRLAKGEKIHVPYRQSKLTRLLQDALGGNSQTLFLACVSPSDTNASETQSTLQYANRARNIKNAPTKNVDANVLELHRLHTLTNILQCELLTLRFSDLLKSPSSHNSSDSETTGETSSSPNTNNDAEKKFEELLQNRDVQSYIESLYKKAEDQRNASSSFNSKTLLSIQPPAYSKKGGARFSLQDSSSMLPSHDGGTQDLVSHPPRTSAGTAAPTDDFEAALLDANPDEDMAILDQLLELQQHDQDFGKTQKEDQQKLSEVEGELKQQEDLLLQLRESLIIYHDMKEKYEVLMTEVQSLESEKASLANQLERASVDPTKGCSVSIKKKLDKVEQSLARARSETRKHQQMYRKAEQEAKKCRALERKINDLKHSKVTLMKKQKEAAARHKEFTEAKTREIQALKRKERKAEKKLTRLEMECRQHKATLERRKSYCEKTSSKLKQTESHLMRLLAMRKRELQDRTKRTYSISSMDKRGNRLSSNQSRDHGISDPALDDSFAPQTDETSSVMFLLKKLVANRVQTSQLKMRYEARVSEYSQLMRTLVTEVKEMNRLKQLVDEEDSGGKTEMLEAIKEHEQNVEDTELQIELVGGDLEDIKSKLQLYGSDKQGKEDVEADTDSSLLQGEAEMKMLSKLSAPVARTTLWDILDDFSHAELERRVLEEEVNRKDAAISGLEDDIDALNRDKNALSKDYEHRLKLARKSSVDRNETDRVEKLELELRSLRSALEQKTRDEEKAATSLCHTKEKLRASEFKLACAREKLALNDALKSNAEATAEAENVLSAIQEVWNETGTPLDDREKLRQRIEASLEETCHKIRSEALASRDELRVNVSQRKERLVAMYTALAVPENEWEVDDRDCSGMSLLQRLKFLDEKCKKLQPTYEAAKDRRDALANDVAGLVDAMELPEESLTDIIKSLRKDQQKSPSRKRLHHSMTRPDQDASSKERRANMLKDVANMVKLLEPIEEQLREGGEMTKNTTDIEVNSIQSHDDSSDARSGHSAPGAAPGFLAASLLDVCEREIKRLRIQKSQTLAENGEVCEMVRRLVEDMHLAPKEIPPLCVEMAKKGEVALPEWWDAAVAIDACDTFTQKGARIGAGATFTKHLNLISASLHQAAAGRRDLVDVLRDTVESAHKALLATVEGETDASEAYASFHDALFRLPSLSQEHIQACIDEISNLVNAVEAVAQSEIEALTVVWDALNISSSERGQFWAEVEEEANRLKTNTESPFSAVLRAGPADLEEWVLASVTDTAKAHRLLDVRLYKLHKIHSEVNKQRLKQDVKSKILSLDSEIRMISARLSDFEEKASKKQRLLTKKKSSSSFLKEERFRKHIQAKFSSKLENLAKLLQEWYSQEGSKFDANILSDDVRDMLVNSDRLDEWVEERTAFMHLKTTKATPKNAKGSKSMSSLRGATTNVSEEAKKDCNRKPKHSRNDIPLPPPPPSSTRVKRSKSPRKRNELSTRGRYASSSPRGLRRISSATKLAPDPQQPQNDGGSSRARSRTPRRDIGAINESEKTKEEVKTTTHVPSTTSKAPSAHQSRPKTPAKSKHSIRKAPRRSEISGKRPLSPREHNTFQTTSPSEGTAQKCATNDTDGDSTDMDAAAFLPFAYALTKTPEMTFKENSSPARR